MCITRGVALKAGFLWPWLSFYASTLKHAVFLCHAFNSEYKFIFMIDPHNLMHFLVRRLILVGDKLHMSRCCDKVSVYVMITNVHIKLSLG
jgi:hypothetical protein